MAGLWSEYQEDERSFESSRFSSTGSRGSTRQSTFNTSVINLKDPGDTTDKRPIFEKEDTYVKETAAIIKLATANRILVVGLLSNKVKRFYTQATELDDVLDIPRPVGDKIHNIFLDPTGKHLLVSMTSGELFYGFYGKQTLFSCSKPMKLNVKVDSVAWNQTKQNDIDTKEILIGNSLGTIYETKLNPSSDKQLVAYSKILYNLDKPEAITGLVYFHENGDPKQRTVVIATTPTRIYQFFGKIRSNDQCKFGTIFGENSFPEFKENVESLGLMAVSYIKYPEPRSLVWMTGVGIQYSKINIDSLSFDEGNVLSENKLTPFTDKGIPVAIGVTEFHLLLLYENGFEAKSLINWKHVHYEPLRTMGGAYNTLALDPMDHSKFFCSAKQSIIRFKVHKEDRNVWRMFMELRKFQEAEKYADGDQAKLFEIASEEGDYYFEQKYYEDAAQTYALSHRSFEEIALKFINEGTTAALMNFLRTKLDSIGNSNSPTQICMLVVWIVEIYLSEISSLEKQQQSSEEESDKLQSTRADLRNFLSNEFVIRNIKKNKPIIKVIQEMMASYGDTSDMIYFADLMEDIEKVIMHHIHDQQYTSALDTLRKRRSPDLFYKYTPTLMKYIPRNTVEVLEQFGRSLDPKRLLPSFIHCKTSDQKEQALRYLQFVVFSTKCKDEAIHNFLLSLVVQQDDEGLLLDFLDKTDANVDRKYALRLCSEHRKWKACCYIYTKMGLYEEAVKLALTKLGNVHEAEKTAVEAQSYCSVDQQEMIKKLWLMIARHVVEEEKDIKRVMEVINRAEQVLKIEDILPFFNDFFYIDDFKDAICKSLEIYNQNINQLNDDMKDATDSAERIHNDINNLKRKNCVVESSKNCYLCDIPLLTRSFYVFPCSHMFHTACLVKEITGYLSKRKAEEVSKIYKILLNLKDEDQTRTESYRRAKSQLDEIIAEECLMCGEYMIQSIDTPFLPRDEEEFEKLRLEWS